METTKAISALEVTVFDWPYRFLVECDGHDEDYPRFFEAEVHPDFIPDAPYLVDLSEMEEGWCGCRDFAVNIMPYLGSNSSHRTVCKHILAAIDYLTKVQYTKPKKLPHLKL